MAILYFLSFVLPLLVIEKSLFIGSFSATQHTISPIATNYYIEVAIMGDSLFTDLLIRW